MKKIFNKFVVSVKHKKNKIKLNFINNSIKNKFKNLTMIQSFENKNVEINFNKKKSINNLILKQIKKKVLNVKN
uniref:Ymf79 n=1 Tax=Paramecium caudatum TaxID=5885 RepID=D8L7T4_PARCA|nr:Ymf79 [Paramecium caudatum]CAZ66821.1 Ymf79 [Paramecium caudatum]